MTAIAAVILAGGRGERLGGVDKARLEIGGVRLIDLAVAACNGCEPILLAVGRNDQTVAGTRSVTDLATDYAGPLAGVAAAVDVLGPNHPGLLLSLAVDTPFFPPDFVARALDLLSGGDAVIGAYGAQDYPTNGLWRLEALRALPAQLRDGTAPHSLKRLAAGLTTRRLDYAPFGALNPFANANTPEDLATLRARAELERRSS
jgi:molybdopterin-guanine dinucleotide biosynthesis protein A